MLIEKERTSWLERPLSTYLPAVNLENVLITVILILAIFSRFYILGARVMSHDETNHVVPSFSLYQGQGYQHDPITHGPFQFHIVALSYFLLGDSDFASRVPAALFSIATVFFGWRLFRRYFGKTGGLLTAFMLLISPYVLFYGRYTRNEAFIGLYALVMIYSMLRYMETGRNRYLYLFTLAVVMHVCSKETSFIYSAQALIFLGVLFLVRVLNKPWNNPGKVRPFLFVLLLAIILVGAGLGLGMITSKGEAAQATPGGNQPPQASSPVPAGGEQALLPPSSLPDTVVGLGILVGAASLYFLVSGFGLKNLRKERSFDLLILLGTLILPSLVALPLKILKVNIPVNATEVNSLTIPNMVQIAAGMIVLFILSAVIGIWWNRGVWLRNAALYYAIFVVFYTTMFTNGAGFVTGIVGSLGYWLAQQPVQRGSQPWYFFGLVQLPMYEYLPLIGTLLALGIALVKGRFSGPEYEEPGEEAAIEATGSSEEEEVEEGEYESTSWEEVDRGIPNGDPVTHTIAGGYQVREMLPIMALLLFWSFSSLAAFSVAGEKMPWLTVHITIPMILCAAWSFGYIIDTTDWARLWAQRGWLVVLLLPVFILALISALGSLLGSNLPFKGNSLVQLQDTANFVFALVGVIASGAGLAYLLKGWKANQVLRLVGVAFLAILAVQTARTAIRANYINYDQATEFLVYAHAARGPKDILAQVEEISKRTTGGLDIAVAYDNDSQYPYWWYLRRYPKKIFFAGNPTRELRNDPIVVVGEANYGKVDAILKDAFYKYDYVRLWWPMQDYFNLTWDRIWYAMKTPELRAAIFDIWANDDFTHYAAVTKEQTLTLTTWQPSNRMRMYIRKDLVAQIWNYGVAPAPEAVPVDPYEKGSIQLKADRILGGQGAEPGKLDAPRGIAVASDGSIYVADSRNNRIQHLAADGKVLQSWGTFADASKGNAPGGTFFEPWGVAVGPDGSVFVSDTWNSRIEKFTADGKFVKMWGYFGQAEKPEAFWGPRGILVDKQGRVFVADTGNKRIVIFDSEGGYINSFGGAGADPGQFDEPVGIAIDPQGNLYVADTWNQRMQVFSPDASGTNFVPKVQWDISGWTGQSVENKPFLAVDQAGHIFATDPEAARVLEFNGAGQFLQTWGDPGSADNSFGLASAVAVDPEGGVWVSDAGNHRLMHFSVPAK